MSIVPIRKITTKNYFVELVLCQNKRNFFTQRSDANTRAFDWLDILANPIKLQFNASKIWRSSFELFKILYRWVEKDKGLSINDFNTLREGVKSFVTT